MRTFRQTKDMIMLAPLGLDDKCILSNSYFPYQIGLEFEVLQLGRKLDFGYDLSPSDYPIFQNEGCLSCDVTSREARYRIVPGAKGFKTLYYLCEHLKENYFRNEEGALHIHVDFREFGNEKPKFLLPGEWKPCLFKTSSLMKETLLKSLDSVGYNRNFNQRQVATLGAPWVRINEHKKTVEFRIFDVTFEYDELVQSVIKVQKVSKWMKSLMKADRKYLHLSSHTHTN